MSDKDLISLYSGEILQLAASVPHAGRLAMPMGSAKKRSPLCGSSLTVEVRLDDPKSGDPIITDFAQDVRACALGQASAAILGRVIIGRRLSEMSKAREALQLMLSENAPAPATPFEGLSLIHI